MIVHDITQGSPEWHKIRCGIPTASNFHKIITAVGWKLSGASIAYAAELIAEWVHGGPLDAGSTSWMDRGKEMEPEAAKAYALLHDDLEVTQVGFVTNDDWTIGGSPDRLCKPNGGLEIKVKGAKIHALYALDPQRLVKAHLPQIMGCIWLCETDWWDIMSYSPIMNPVIVRVERDEEQIGKLASAVEAFAEQLAVQRKQVIDGE
ncbi:hypothetical protein LCGC14_1131330 [marine sediment metagenome]|uniref:YqaJ viral recombinase domain-containing protein n=1 Tax=marine sediment metagenome TaxID=412755 RepID=A0A0F9PJ75_9ZZZZ